MSDSGDIPAIVNGLAGVEEPNTMGEGISRTVDDIVRISSSLFSCSRSSLSLPYTSR